MARRSPLTTNLLRTALQRVGAILPSEPPVEILVVGGAAGMLTGQLSPARITLDCDVMVYAPANAWHVVEDAAHRVGRELGLTTSWLNSVVQLRTDSLPAGWRERRILVGDFGPLRVFAVGRLDLIAMKFIAHRPQDLEDLEAMDVTADEVRFVRAFLEGLRGTATPRQEIDEAIEILSEWRASL